MEGAELARPHFFLPGRQDPAHVLLNQLEGRMSQARWLVATAALVAFIALPGVTSAQVEIDNNFKYNSGQDVQPIFDGWSHNPDGSFALHFGYLNRNYVQELSIPVGPANNIEPGGPDRGQPGYFYTRTQRNVFTVTVPKDWGKKEVTWTVTANGKTQKAVGWLQPEWEMDPVGGSSGGRTDQAIKNQPPTLDLPASLSATVSTPLTLNAKVTDDGLPKPAAGARGRPAVGQETPPILTGGVSDAPVNVPSVAGPALGAGAGAGAGGGRGRGAAQGPTVRWLVWRGPAAVTFTPPTATAKDNQAQSTAVFSKPGEYVLRGIASDRQLNTTKDVKVTVK